MRDNSDLTHDLVHDLSRTIGLDETELNGSVVARFRRVIGLLPVDHLAYVDTNKSLTYHALDQLSDGVAVAVAAQVGWGDGVGASKPVALLLPHEAISIAAILGTLKAGHFYVPLDPSQGESSLQQIVSDCAPPLLLTVSSLLAMAQAIVGQNAQMQIRLIDELPQPVEGERFEVNVHGQATVSIQYTSGSTGQPRGIIRTHAQNIKSAYNLCIDSGYRPSDRVAHLLSYAHGTTTLVIFGALLHGATIYARTARDLAPKPLYEWLQACQITQLSLSVGMVRALGELADSYPPLTSIRMVGTGGEAINSSAVRRMQQLLAPECAFVIRLGITEAGTLTSLVVPPEMSWEGERVPAGYMVPLMDVTILDDKGNRLERPAVGQIAVRSRYLAAGYWNQPAQTAAKFLDDPEGGDCRTYLTGDMGYFDPDGMLVFLGRKDFMVKIRGFRVELEAVEAALVALPSVQEAVVLAQEVPSGEKRLVAYVVARNAANGEMVATSQTWRTQLAASLPEYMVPSLFVPMASFSRNIGGKVDRKALPIPENLRPELSVAYVAPRTETEAQVALIWEDLLGVNPVGVHDDFFSLGGNSLLAMRMSVRVENRWHKALPSAFFLTPTISCLGSWLDGKSVEEVVVGAQPAEVNSDAKEVRPAGKRKLFARPKLNVRHKMRRLPERAASLMPFEQGWRWLHHYCSQTNLMRVLYTHEYECFQRMADEFAIPSNERVRAFRMYLVSNIITTLQKREVVQPLTTTGLFTADGGWPRFFQTIAQRLATTEVGDATAFVRFTGLEFVEEAYQQGQGVILLSFHTPTSRFAMTPLVRHLGVEGIATLSGRRESSIGTLTSRSLALVAEITQRAMQILRQGGVLQILNDYGYEEQGTLPFPIGGRTYLLKPGFAELALATGATVIPFYSSWQDDGRIHAVFLPPMAESQCEPESMAARQQAVANMVEGYATFVESRLRKMPDSWTWAVNNHFLERPPHKSP